MKEVAFFFDFSSPFAYLAATQIEAVAARHDARVVYRPFLLWLRVLVTDLGMPEGAPAQGDWMFLGRLECRIERQIREGFFANSAAFIEQSDRDDPIGLRGPLPVAPRMSVGATLSLSVTLL